MMGDKFGKGERENWKEVGWGKLDQRGNGEDYGKLWVRDVRREE
jgi:hypothetical protein